MVCCESVTFLTDKKDSVEFSSDFHPQKKPPDQFLMAFLIENL